VNHVKQADLDVTLLIENVWNFVLCQHGVLALVI